MKEFTTKQIAELLGVSKPTVQKKIKELAVSPERTDNNKRAYYSYADTVAVIQKIKPNYDFSLLVDSGAKPPTDTAKPQNEPPNTAKPQNFVPNFGEQTAKPQSEELEFLKRALSVIESQLAEKDKQLAVKDEQIKDLSNRLAEAMELNKGLQYITATEKTTELLEADTKKQQQEEPPIVVEEADTEVADSPSSWIPEREDKGTEEPEPQKKKSFWQRLFS